MKRRLCFVLTTSCIVLQIFPIRVVAQTELPLIISLQPNIQEYTLFGNSGWDGNWYVGYNNCWIVKLPPLQEDMKSKYRRAYIGAKLGRSKTEPLPGLRIWERKPIYGEIYVSINSTPSWSKSSQYLLITTEHIPPEGDPIAPVSHTGGALWFWTEVPIDKISTQSDNYICIWSKSEKLSSRDTAPILCGAWSYERETKVWLNNDIKGSAPSDPKTSCKQPITIYEPAIAIKLVADTTHPMEVSIYQVPSEKLPPGRVILLVEVKGEYVEYCWLEASKDKKDWKKISPYLTMPPYMFTVDAIQLPEGNIFVRGVAKNIWENYSYSPEISLTATKNVVINIIDSKTFAPVEKLESPDRELLFSLGGIFPRRIGLEVSKDKKKWKAVAEEVKFTPTQLWPWCFKVSDIASLKKEKNVFFRLVVTNLWNETYYSKEIELK
jgi:hypothetical protein